MLVDSWASTGVVAVLAAPFSRLALSPRPAGASAGSCSAASCSGRTHQGTPARFRNMEGQFFNGGRRRAPHALAALEDDAQEPSRRRGRRAKATGSSSAASTPAASSSSGSSSDSDTKSVPESDGDDDDDDGADPARRMASLVALVAMSTDQNPSAVAKHLRDDAETYRALEREAKGSAGVRAAEGPERRIARNLEVLVNELGCAPADLAAIVRAFPGVLALDADDDVRSVVQFLTGPIPLGGVGMTTAAAKECVRRDPKMLGQSVKDALRPKFEYLVEHAGLRPGNVGDMLWLDLETQIKPRVEFLALECGMGSTAAAAAIRNFPPSQSHVLYRHFENPENMARKALKCLREEVGMSADQVSFAIGRFPKILDYSPEKIAGCFEFLRSTCALTEEECRRVIAATPQVVGLSVEENMAPKHRLLVHELGLGEDGAREVIACFPNLWTVANDNIRARFTFFLETVGCSREDLTAMLASHPHGVLSLSTDNILESMNFIENVFATLPADDTQRRTLGDGGPRELAVAVLAKVPMLLGYSVERKMRPTVDYIRETHPDVCAFRALKMCTNSLGGTIMPRCYFKERAGWNVLLVTAVHMSKSRFCEKVGITVAEYDEKAAEFIELTERMHPPPAKPRTPAFAIRSAIKAQTKRTTLDKAEKAEKGTTTERRRATRREAAEARRRAAAKDAPDGE
ncbi:predicted protein [Micromonas commoda]|uniref:Uncharacterized protein n=1 Tax=Micromonas commoda (strain RCC299 / NOUM17 / CCMP2709) TaxID=296587 RepID=C1FJ49_MICCC|nr:predicted protein [Micromonas commoda]ACO70529.1 predicted protein [Micromonas commoda]|eukprot:XP_002509271.1 predicted protein [Micromonas commoda]